MNKIGRIFEIGYLVVAAVFSYEAFNKWSVESELPYVFILMAALAAFMFFFKRRMRLKREDYFKQNKE